MLILHIVVFVLYFCSFERMNCCHELKNQPSARQVLRFRNMHLQLKFFLDINSLHFGVGIEYLFPRSVPLAFVRNWSVSGPILFDFLAFKVSLHP